MNKIMDLNEKFDNYFHELEGFGMRSERFYAEFQGNSNLAISMHQWLKSAYMQGCRDMAQDTVYTLLTYGTAVAGLDEVCYNSTQAYDTAAESLTEYYKQIIKD